MTENRSKQSEPSPETQHKITLDEDQVPPSFTAEEAKQLVARLYGLNVQNVTELDSFLDQNFRITVTDGSDGILDYTMKIINAKDSSNEGFMQGMIDILLYLEENGISCPKPVKMLNGNYLSKHATPGGAEHAIYLQTYIHGVPLNELKEISLPQCYSVGAYLGRMHKALQGFEHCGLQNEKGQWRMENVCALKNYIQEVCDEDQRQLVLTVLKSFEDNVVPLYSSFHKGIIHGDYRAANVIVQPNDIDKSVTSEHTHAITGLIDFGDVTFSCFMFEIAITTAHFVMEESKNPSLVAERVLAGYETEFSLTDQERAQLEVCTLARMAQVAVVGSFELQKQPTNEYVKEITTMAWKSLKRHIKEPIYKKL
ncbi:hydroxylysine kinase-like [Ptychodera flava]|uniref:hydroxylysine kinase-like n=1 Tax=Ptychodera flava TaxID=63121 RepID=UPI00396A4D00